jgi:hypothetical protein
MPRQIGRIVPKRDHAPGVGPTKLKTLPQYAVAVQIADPTLFSL